MLAFTGKNPDGSFWCGPCRNLYNTAFAQGEFREWAAANAVLLEVEVPSSGDRTGLIDRFGVRGFGVPALKFVDANGGRVRTPFDGSADWMRRASGYVH